MVLKIILSTLGLVTCGLVGHLISGQNTRLNRDLSKCLVLGYACLIVVFRIGFRIGLTPNISAVVFFGFAVVAILKIVLDRREKFHTAFRKPMNLWSLASLSVLIIPLFPYLTSGALFYFHAGPDMTGHLLSAASIRQGRSYSDAMRVLLETSGSSPWWSLTSMPWSAIDFREALEIEFLLRSSRIGHGAVTSFISLVTGFETPESLLIGICFSLVLSVAVLIRNFKNSSLSALNSSLLALGIGLSPSYIFMVHEGVTAQIFALPIVFTLLFESSEMFYRKFTRHDLFLNSVLISALLGTMLEAAQLYGLFLFTQIIVRSIIPQTRLQSRLFLSNTIKIILTSIVLVPFQSLDFIRNFILRFQQSFRYSGFGIVDWDPLSILVPLPILEISSFETFSVKMTASQMQLIIESVVLILLSFLIWFLKKDQKVLTALSVSVAMLIVALLGGGYPIWKFVIFFQPVLITGLLVALFASSHRGQMRVLILAVPFFSLSVFGLSLLPQYNRASVRLMPEAFRVGADSPGLKDKVIVTPLTSGLYSNLGGTEPFIYANSGWGPIFRDADQKLEIVLYYSCEIEGLKRCSVIADQTNDRILEDRAIPTGLSVHILLDESGRVDRDKLEIFIRETFGVQSTVENP